MSISEIELKFLVNNVKEIIDDVYYISTIYPITKNSLIIKFHHSQKNDISLLVSTFGICITKYKYSVIEENEAIKKIKSELERSKLIDVSVLEGERIIQFIFQNITGIKYSLIVELFGNGNIILCNESLRILSLINSINVRHRTLKPGLNYAPPPPRGVNPFSINFDDFLSLVNTTQKENIDIKRWLGRNLSISKKFIDYIVNNSKIKNKNINELSSTDLKILFDELISLIKNLSNGVDHEPCIILDENGKSIDISPIIPYGVDSERIKNFDSYQDAVDEFLNNLIVNSDASKNSDLEKHIELLEHDLQEQEKAKSLVISKSAKLRDFANLLMQQTDTMMNIENPNFQKILFDFNAKILNIKGKSFLEIVDEKMSLDSSNFNIPKLSSSLFSLAKEKERGLITIENSQLKLLEQIDKLKQQKDKKPLSSIKVLTNKEWYEKYRWFFTSDGLLAIGGKDASSNSVIIRKLLTENDFVFHAEVNGSPFFILQNANNSNTDISQSILEVSQATVSFSRSWKGGLSSSDAYWVLPSQIKKGAPTGQYLPKGSFVIEGKRNFVKNIEIKLAIGLSFTEGKSIFTVGPYHAIKKRSILVRTLLPSGLDVVKASKKIKADFVDHSIKNDFPQNRIEYLKSLSIDEIVRILPVGQCKLLPIEKGDMKDDFNKITEK
ncbi:MAG: NFACT family protein [Nitrosopumilus sp.]|nr:NFACT family protein [Nitrosopumilus sp.]